jgi:hypothetical protein
MTAIPADPALYRQVVKEAASIYKKSSAYRSGYIVKTYKNRGGKYLPSNEHQDRGNLRRWFREKWVDLNRRHGKSSYEPCGRKRASQRGPSTICRPSIRISPKTPLTVQELSIKKIRKVKKTKLNNPTARLSFKN